MQLNLFKWTLKWFQKLFSFWWRNKYLKELVLCNNHPNQLGLVLQWMECSCSRRFQRWVNHERFVASIPWPWNNHYCPPTRMILFRKIKNLLLVLLDHFIELAFPPVDFALWGSVSSGGLFSDGLWSHQSLVSWFEVLPYIASDFGWIETEKKACRSVKALS